MAPITRNAQSAGGIGKKVHRKRSTQKEPSHSWALMHHQEKHPNAMDVPMDDSDEDESAEANYLPDIAQTIEPLREIYGNVKDKVERFAEELDKFLTTLPTVEEEDRFEAVHDLVSTFKEIADGAVEELKQKHQFESNDHTTGVWSQPGRTSTTSTAQKSQGLGTSSLLSTSKAKHVKELRQWQQEADIWDLFRIMLELHPFKDIADAQHDQRTLELEELGPAHRYISEQELWERFLLEDGLAREQEQIKSWLERTAVHQQGDMQGMQAKGLETWSAGWMDTREKIKGQKLVRNWPTDEASPLPQIRRTDNNELMVTTLDPDAPTRQGRSLEKPDAERERAIWSSCWDMLRRGTDLTDVCSWCEERKEGWQAVCLGQSMDITDPTLSGAAWRRVCELASQAPNPNEYESAVFGLLGGNAEAVEKVCRSVDDHLYAFYSAYLVKRFDEYLLETCPAKAAPSGLRRIASDENDHEPERFERETGSLIQRLRKEPSTKDESAEPMKIIQSYLIADQVGSLIKTIGVAVGETSKLHGTDETIFLQGEGSEIDPLSLPELEVMLNSQTLRIVAHMAILYGVLSPDSLTGDELLEDENVLVAYIKQLKKEGKIYNIPTYAARLRGERSIAVLSSTLQNVLDTREQIEFLGLLHSLDIDVVGTMTRNLDSILETALKQKGEGSVLSILERTDNERLYPGRQMKVDFLPAQLDEEDHAIIYSLSWLRLNEGGWKVTFDALSLAVRKCLVTGRFACAREIIANNRTDNVSYSKSYETIHKSMNVFDFDEESAPRDEDELRTLKLLQRQARTYSELEELVQAIEALSLWRSEEYNYTKQNPKPHTVPSSIKQLHRDVTVAMQPILKGILLEPATEEEAKDLMYIRIHYIPEVIIAYITFLHTSGSIITRENLLDAMDVATTIAKGKDTNGDMVEYNGLEECFVQAGRMRELVECFALVSKLMLVLKAEGRTWKPKKDKEMRDLGMFEIGGRAAVNEEE